jgi:hypothetical protein
MRMKETATTTSLGSIGQITEEHELIIDVQVEESSPVKPDATQESKQARALKEERENEELEEDRGDDYDDEIVENYADSWSYEVPRPWLTVEQAASMLGRSTRGVERSILGRWGNHLPEGWSARRVRIDGVDEWRIIPPPGFRIKHSRRETNRRDGNANTSASNSARTGTHAGTGDSNIEDVEASPIHSSTETPSSAKQTETTDKTASKSQEKKMAATPNSAVESPSSVTEPFSFEKFFQSAGKMAQKELASFGLTVRPTSERTDKHGIVDADIEHATIVIDRSDEVEKLLRELANTQKELAEQRRMHLDDLRLMQEMQRSMLLLEVNAKETGELKQDLTYAQQALKEHRSQYQAFLALPWYKRLFRKTP